jgi:hypothetical protein
MKRNYNRFLCFFVAFATLSLSFAAGQGFDKSAYYKNLSLKDVKRIDDELTLVKTLPLPDRDAYEGALLAKKAGLAGKAKEKLNLFKAGKKKLESAINADSRNTEWRFLRLIIQENAPKVVNYKDNIRDDSEHVKKNFQSLPEPVKKIVLDYSKNSKVLKPSDF